MPEEDEIGASELPEGKFNPGVMGKTKVLGSRSDNESFGVQEAISEATRGLAQAVEAAMIQANC